MKRCPRCQGKLDYEEVDIGVGLLKVGRNCDCGWYPEGDDEDYINCTTGGFV